MSDKDLSNADKQRLLQVLGDLCNGQLNAPDEPWLQELLTENASARAVYIDYWELDASLTAEGITLADQDMTSADASITTAAHDLANFSSSSAVSTGRSGIASFWRKLPSWAVAATLFGIALFSSATTLGLISLLKSTDSQVAVASAQVVARITGTQNSLWRHEATHPIGYGSELVAGKNLNFKKGWLKSLSRMGQPSCSKVQPDSW